MVFGAFSEISKEARKLLCYPALLKNRLYRRWGINTAREYARIKIDGLRPRAATRTSPTRPGTATTTHASTTGSKLTYTLPTPLPGRQAAQARGPKTRIDYSYCMQTVSLSASEWPYRG